MRKAIAAMALLCCCSSAPALAQVSFAFDSPGVSIAVNVPVYPELVRIPGYPVYYAPGLPANYFFYDGLFWVFVDGNWYASPWYDGPWQFVSDDAVPLFLLRVPVRYYRAPPPFFRGWAVNAPPHWGQHWGARWEERHRGWDRWNRSVAPAPAPLPTYQRSYAGNRYPRSIEEQRTLETRNYHYQPHDRFAQQHVQRAPVQNAQGPRATPRTNAANGERPRNETRQPAGRTPPGLARHATPSDQRNASAAATERRPPATGQQARAQRPEPRASGSREEQRASAPRPEPRAAATRPEQRVAAPRREPRAARAEQRAAMPRQEQRAATPPQQRAAAASRGQASATGRGPAQRSVENRGQAQAAHGRNENARAGERKNEHNG
jgi:hypothetical protein